MPKESNFKRTRITINSDLDSTLDFLMDLHTGYLTLFVYLEHLCILNFDKVMDKVNSMTDKRALEYWFTPPRYRCTPMAIAVLASMEESGQENEMKELEKTLYPKSYPYHWFNQLGEMLGCRADSQLIRSLDEEKNFQYESGYWFPAIDIEFRNKFDIPDNEFKSYVSSSES